MRSSWKKMLATTVSAVAMLAWSAPHALAAPLPGGSLDPTTIPKYQDPLVIPPAMPRTSKIMQGTGAKQISYYEIAVRQFEQQILPAGFDPTTVWSYGSVNHPGTFNYPAFTIEAKWDQPVRVRWINDLKDPATGEFLPHLLPIDPTLHWANPPGGEMGRDMRPTYTFPDIPAPYTGPVPIVTHVHGAHAGEESDGYPEAWYLPAATNLPAGYATRGTFYDEFEGKAFDKFGVAWEPGSATFQYANMQAATTLWYHDHSLGITRANVYAGPAGFYLLRGGPSDMVVGTLPGPAPALGDLPGMAYYEIPIVFQDRSFDADGSLFYPDSREFFDGFAGPYLPGLEDLESDISPIWNPEFFGNTIVTNGKTWPFLDVEQRRYRFRFLNGCNSRFLILASDVPLTFWQIGGDGGFLPAPVASTQMLLGPAERADTIVDFSGLPEGTMITLLNYGPDEPFGGGTPYFGCGDDPAAPEDCFEPSDAGTTGQLMQFRVVKRKGPDKSTPPQALVLPAPAPMPMASNTRQVSLNELDSALVCLDAEGTSVPCGEDTEPVGPLAAMLGTVGEDEDGSPVGLPAMWHEGVTENPALGATETWEIFNFTMDAHPIHIHQVQFQIVDRQVIGDAATRPPEPAESGRKDTVIAYPGEITRVTATFDEPGLFVWHCHILEHEDNEMMRPFRVVP